MRKFREQCNNCEYQKSKGMCWAKPKIAGLYDFTNHTCPDYKSKETNDEIYNPV